MTKHNATPLTIMLKSELGDMVCVCIRMVMGRGGKTVV